MGRFISGASSGGGAAEIIAFNPFEVTGTWTKPATALPTDLVVVDMWDGGCSGAIGGSAARSGGAGGNFNRFEFSASKLSATEPVVVGAGAAAVVGATVTGNVGGLSSFSGIGSRTAPGAAAGTAPTAGSCATDDLNSRGGLCALTISTTAMQVSIRAGGQGGNSNTTGLVALAGAKSMAGGNGGAAAAGAGVTATNGTAPGGGGGSASGTGTLTSGAGARGEVRVYVIRGVFTVGDAILPTSI